MGIIGTIQWNSVNGFGIMEKNGTISFKERTGNQRFADVKGFTHKLRFLAMGIKIFKSNRQGARTRRIGVW
ncbi:hypothetical protein CLOBOL_03926 [Enterocloster bolteae ATCC BAA-613]|uniref:Uncharacterized protein n=2 Tax=Enterocloster bolteae TaxID=208479 RepID=A0A414AUZ9_9FIRM|nr:hypothetical protein CGC65_14380 [Enterocloster bolteae]EDP15755.1 hypothetical protein CLOBOL_03926 [Enterocloster bolteae ATCC BAA-613]PQL52986.1 hypothetical protein C5Z06_23120 [Enterocloster bolteae]RGK76667.1 hypothetical protein DXC96_06390 [Enterocloster bolteae]RGS09007.1 hypothetical protein DWY12_15235 [Enterocloster bolteae]